MNVDRSLIYDTCINTFYHSYFNFKFQRQWLLTDIEYLSDKPNTWRDYVFNRENLKQRFTDANASSLQHMGIIINFKKGET